MKQHESTALTDALKVVPRVHIVGRKNAGKTTLVCDLVRELTQRGYKVATIKHTHHHHELDTPGKDSHQHRESGATGVGILSSQMTAAFIPVERDDDEAKRYARFNIMFNDCDFIIVEGDLHTKANRIEVWREALAEAPYATEDNEIDSVISDDRPNVTCPVCSRTNIQAIADLVVKLQD